MAEIPLGAESAGTLKMFALYPELQEVLEKGSVFFIDELNARLHPLLVRNFLLTFLNPNINVNHAQLVFTTHDTWQLSNQLLRRDEIWFVEKDDRGVSTLYSLADFVDEDGARIRKDESYEKAQYRIPWIVFDRDQVIGFDEIISEAEKKGIQVGWSNPCFEIWMYTYFGAMPAIQDSWTCCSEFGRVYESKTGQKYSKADEKMYGKISNAGNEEKAIQIAQQKLEQCEREGKKKPSEMCPGTTVHRLVGEIRYKTNN